ncbi:serine/threonine-protein kinase/endoribonuclease IRE1-like [Daphnia pulex]|uniref:serine/threonine-protein kinase/endoribonuclease IRE1-like n=1 Tax=Daphnia pulex TaxID=6669 RepID=UPI001EE0283C|nr:serine/threonine-protein kinase/endoribonuclease IRE1-like [Daphnia pulex]
MASNTQGEEALQGLDHSNVIKLFHAESDANFRYYYLELCNASLEKLFLKDGHKNKYRGPMPPSLTALYQLAVGLEYIHKMGLVHRDLKPENVLIWQDPRKGNVLLKWADFGLCKQVNERGSYSMSGVRGTFDWLAPEILNLFNDEELSQSESETTSTVKRGTIQSDVFSEGLVFGYFLLDGRHLFGLRHQIHTHILDNKPVNLDKIQSQCARDLILKMLRENIVERITSSEVAEFLKKIKSQFETQLFALCSRDSYPSLEEVTHFLQEGVDFNCTDEEGMSPLHYLANRKYNGQNNLLEILQLLIQHGIDVNCKNNDGLNALFFLCRYYQKENVIEIIQLLIQHGIDINCKNNDGSNVLTLLRIYYRHFNLNEIIELLIQHRMDRGRQL